MIYLHWKKYQENMMQRLKEVGEALVMAGDGRHDSIYGAQCQIWCLYHILLYIVQDCSLFFGSGKKLFISFALL